MINNGDGNNSETNTKVSRDLLDGASSDIKLTHELSNLTGIAANKDNPMEERLEAIEDIFESEVGDTAFSRARNLEREFNVRQLYLKFEGNNPTGTQKDRIAFAQVIDALRRGYDTLAQATCGNYGVAMAFATNIVGLKCKIVLPEGYKSKRIDEMRKYGADIMRAGGDYETAVKTSQSIAVENDYYDANPGGLNTNLQLKAYGEIAYEIYDELRDAPHAVAVPVSNGTTIAGIYRGFVSLYRRGKTSRIPRFIAGSSYMKNPIVKAFFKNMQNCEDLAPDRIKETRINEPLINWHSLDGDHALAALRDSNGFASYVSDKNMLKYSKLLREKEGFNVLPASTAGLIAFLEAHKKNNFPNDRYVIVLTGKK